MQTQCPGNNFTRKQIHYACQIDKSIGCPDISDITAQYLIEVIKSTVFMQDILKSPAEIGIYDSDHEISKYFSILETEIQRFCFLTTSIFSETLK